MMHKAAALGYRTSTSNTFHTPQQGFTQAERFGPTTLSSTGYESFQFPDQTFRGTERTSPNLVSRIILCRNYTRKGRCSYGASCKL
jgi:hypothetical protein